MSCPVSVTIHAEQTDIRTIQKNRFISCLVRFQEPRFVSKGMGFCLHCRELLSYNGALKHAKQLAENEQINLASLFRPEKIDSYKEQILSDAEMVWEMWCSKLSGFPRDAPIQMDHCECSEARLITDADPVGQTTQTAEGSCMAEQYHRSVDGEPDFIEQDPLFEVQWDCLEECILNRWSCFPGLNSMERFREAEAVLRNLFVDANDEKRNIMKSRVISRLLRRLSLRLSLSRNQNSEILSFLKSVITFIAPEKEVIARRIFASHTTCQRQSIKDEERRFVLCRKNMEECLFFSFAVDTALFRNQHIISCIGRFSFDNKAQEVPLFISLCTISSGKEMALFLFERLKERNAMFNKLISVATDGAANMVGKFN